MEWVEHQIQRLVHSGIFFPTVLVLGLLFFWLYLWIYPRIRGEDWSQDQRDYLKDLGQSVLLILALMFAGTLVFAAIALIAYLVAWIVSLFA